MEEETHLIDMLGNRLSLIWHAGEEVPQQAHCLRSCPRLTDGVRLASPLCATASWAWRGGSCGVRSFRLSGARRCVGELLHDGRSTNESGQRGGREEGDGSLESWTACTVHVMRRRAFRACTCTTALTLFRVSRPCITLPPLHAACENIMRSGTLSHGIPYAETLSAGGSRRIRKILTVLALILSGRVCWRRNGSQLPIKDLLLYKNELSEKRMHWLNRMQQLEV